MPQNRAVYIEAPKASSLVVKDAPYTPPGAGEIVIKNAVVAINPADPKMQDYAFVPLEYPAVFGCDTAGIIEDVGEGVTDFKKGDRVIAYVHLFYR
jgi:NADPH:quinone reductase-like Zn-dependent oxidoreductase